MSNAPAWSDTEKSRLAELHGAGCSIDQISEIMHRPKMGVRIALLRHLGIRQQKPQKPARKCRVPRQGGYIRETMWTRDPQRLDFLHQLWLADVPALEIGRKLGCSDTEVQRAIIRYFPADYQRDWRQQQQRAQDLSAAYQQRQRPRSTIWTRNPAKLEEARALWLTDMTGKAIAQQVGCCESELRRAMIRHFPELIPRPPPILRQASPRPARSTLRIPKPDDALLREHMAWLRAVQAKTPEEKKAAEQAWRLAAEVEAKVLGARL